MDLRNLSLTDKIIGATGVLLLIDLLFLPWHSVDLIFTTFTRTGIESPGGGWGVLALLVTIAILAAIAVTVTGKVKVPDLPVPLNQAVFYATIAVTALLLVKLVSETDHLGFGAYFGILLAGGMTYGGFLKSRESASASGLA